MNKKQPDPQGRYDHQATEAKWQRYWNDHQLFQLKEDPARKNYYCLVMFPYPSGRIHTGHVRNYVIGDVIARYKAMCGNNVLHPIGWDAFGLPAENAAIERGIHPAEWTRDNIEYMRRQLKRLGISYDWSREVNTSQPDYYGWNQWLFLKMYERGLAYKKQSPVNWCPSCETVLANEQVIDGTCWRCDTVVEQKDLEQWFFKITAYAEELLQGCDKLTGWPERVLTMQRNWIGKSIGAEVDFPLADMEGSIRIFTTRQDTLFGATFMSLAPEHPIVEKLIEGKPEADTVRIFVERIRGQDKKTRTAEDLDKEGVFTGRYAINPMTHQRIPIWVANFVLMEYGTGAIMAVPAHDQRDFEFAKKYRIPIRIVIQNTEGTLTEESMTQAHTEETGYLIHSDPFSGLSPSEAKGKIADDLETQHLGKQTVNYRLRDWGISRQRYWGTPIPIIYCEGCGPVQVPYEDLPVKLPQDVPLTGKGGSPLSDHKTFSKTACPKCKKQARREADTMDTFVDSSWYFLRYLSPHLDHRPFDEQAADHWMPVNQYIGGIEHAVLHLLYARFFTKVVRDLGLLKVDEPFSNLLTQGMVVKEIFRCPEHGYLFPGEVASGNRCTHCHRKAEIGRMEKMSKSKKNVVEPDDLMTKYGADTLRLFCLFAAPPEKDLEWSDQGVEGGYRFLNRVWRLVNQQGKDTALKNGRQEGSRVLSRPELELRRATHQTIKKVTEDLDRNFQFNTAIAALMEFYNFLSQTLSRDEISRAVLDEALNTLVVLLFPFAPHLAEELWEQSGQSPSIARKSWPSYDPRLLITEEITLAIQINGKLRSQMTVPAHLMDEEIKKRALADDRIQKWLKNRHPKKTLYVKGRLVNIVYEE
jgi:leucyl-tRNA synthetase